MFWKVLLNRRLLNVAEPMAGPWPGSGSSLTQMPKPDLASNASPLFKTPEIEMFVNIVSVTGVCSGYLVWNMMPEYVGSMMSTSLTRMPRNSFDAAKAQIAPNVWLPQKWPPARTSEMFWNVVSCGPKPTNGYPKSSELMVRPAYVNVSAM